MPNLIKKNKVVVSLFLLFLGYMIFADDDKKIYEFNELADHSSWSKLLQKHVSDSGTVNYKGFISESTEFNAYLNELSSHHPASNWSREDVLAYWINAYNAFTIKLIVDNYPIKSIKDIEPIFGVPWYYDFIKIQENTYDLDYIEHQILRKMNEPRIHFAIVCASYSCPNLLNEAFESVTLEKQLESQATFFINDTGKNIINDSTVELSKIFEWFGQDFETETTSLVDYINKYSKLKISESNEVKYLDYKWELNE